MKLVAFIIGLSFVTLSVSANHNKINQALNNGDAMSIASFFGNNVDLKIIDKENVFSKSQATILVKDFFEKHKAQSFTVKHEGGPANAKFTIGTFIDSTGKTFRVYYLLMTVDSKIYIHKFRIEEDG